MDEYINRADAIEVVNHAWAKGLEPTQFLESIPAADVAQVRHGEWERCFEDWRKQIEGDKCSCCGFEHYGTSIKNYRHCPNCGAKMDKE